jgi:hypothetical protein
MDVELLERVQLSIVRLASSQEVVRAARASAGDEEEAAAVAELRRFTMGQVGKGARRTLVSWEAGAAQGCRERCIGPCSEY